MRELLRPTHHHVHHAHHGGWRLPHAYRTPGERASLILFWTVIGTTLAAAIGYSVYLIK